MTRHAKLVFILLAVILCSASAAYGNGATPQAPAIDPKAEQTLKLMSDYLRGLQSFSVHVDAVVEGVLPSGERLDTDRSGDIWIERPNKLRVNMVSAKHNVQMYYDGSTFVIYSPVQNYYGSWNAPGTLEQTVAAARTKYGLVLPGGDFLASDPYGKLMAHVESGTYLGEVPIGGTLTHHLAFRQPDIDWQIWIEASDTPVPRRIIITDKRTSDEPQYMASFSNWKTSLTIDPCIFVFTPPAGAQKIGVSMLPVLKQRVVPVKPLEKGGQK